MKVLSKNFRVQYPKASLPMSTSHGSTTMVHSMRVLGIRGVRVVVREPEGEFSGRPVGFDRCPHSIMLRHQHVLEGLCLKEDTTDGLLLVKALEERHCRWTVTSQGP